MPSEKMEVTVMEPVCGAKIVLIATKQLVDYCVDHPDAEITGVTFNCPERSYDVFCGILDQRLDAICVIVGWHIPSYAMRH
jgi:hypothetical protein